MTDRIKATALVIAAAAAATLGCEGAELGGTSGRQANAPPASRTQQQGQQGEAERANQGAQATGERLNREAVGRETEARNEQQAQNPPAPNPPEEKREAREKGEAVGKTTTTAAETVVGAEREVTRATERPGPYEPYAVEYNPLGLFVGGRVSFNFEWVPVTHHAIVVSPHIARTSANIAVSPTQTQSQSYGGFGGEVGYRYYTGHRGPNGIFVGPSLIMGVYNASLPSGDQAFTDVGVALDAGVQTILWDHLVLGGGLGLEYLHVSHDFADLPAGPSTIASSGLKPRFLFSAGYGF